MKAYLSLNAVLRLSPTEYPKISMRIFSDVKTTKSHILKCR